jgi:uncharacterized protein YprB with RNaseH-like and TPR domain
MRVCIFDIETTELEAVGAGIFLCGSILPIGGGKIRSFRIDKYDYKPSDEFGPMEREEKALLIDYLTELDKYDMLVGHNIERFDIPYLRSRAYQHKIEWHTAPIVYDTCKAFRRTGFLTKMNGFGKPSASMAMVSDFLGIEQLKTGIYPSEWWKSVWGKKDERTSAMNEMLDHNIRDVRLNASLYPILLENDIKLNIHRML